MAPFIRVLRAFEGETIEIHWQCADGSEFLQTVTIPPKATRDAMRADQHLAEQLLQEIAAKRNGAGQVLERPNLTAAGQRFAASSTNEPRRA